MKFGQGQKGNPGGRPRLRPEQRRKLKACFDKALDKLLEALSADGPPSVPAIKEAMDRYMGKAPQSLEVSHQGKGAAAPREMTDAELNAAIAEGRARLAALNAALDGGIATQTTGTLTVQ